MSSHNGNPWHLFAKCEDHYQVWSSETQAQIS